MDLSVGGDNVTQQRLRPFHIDCEIVVDKKHCNLAALFLGALF